MYIKQCIFRHQVVLPKKYFLFRFAKFTQFEYYF